MFLYITFVNVFKDVHIGMLSKIYGQCAAFQKEMGRTAFASHTYEVAELYNKEELIEREIAIDRYEYIEVLKKWIKKHDVKNVYIRFHFSDKPMYEFMNWLKSNGIKTVLEIPTFPYDKELPYGVCKVEDSIYRERIVALSDFLTTYTEETSIWGQQATKLTNGVDIHTFEFIDRTYTNKDIIEFLSVSSMCFWHGLERFILGLSDYIKNNNFKPVRLMIVGDGRERELYETLVSSNNLENFVSFTGMLNRNRLEEYYNKADIAIGSLGMYKSGISYASPIKISEYCAYGLPVLFGYNDTRFTDDYQYAYRVDNSESVIDIEQVIKWFQDIRQDNNYRKSIRSYAENYLSWDHIMKPVIEMY